MDRPESIKNGDLSLLLAEQVEAHRSELVQRYHKHLMATIFTNRSDVRPDLLPHLAQGEVDALLAFFRSAAPADPERGAQLCQVGLSEKSLLQLGRATRQFFADHLESDRLAPAFDIVGLYQDALIQGFVRSRETIILSEQERIRKAFELTISRFTVEIKEVQALAQRAAEANEFKSRFIARISHELRTPLGAILGMSEMLQHNIYGPLTAMQEDIIQRIVNNVRGLERIFSEFLDQSQLEAGHLYLKEAEFSPQVLAHTVYTTCLSLALQKGLALHLQIDPDMPNILVGDSKRIQQILNNLVVNAIKYTETGRVDIEIRKHLDTHWALRVKDTGVGISKEAQAYIFEPFRQSDETIGRRYDGVGLGLAIVQELVTLMQGTVSLESVIGQGSMFTILLPLRT